MLWRMEGGYDAMYGRTVGVEKLVFSFLVVDVFSRSTKGLSGCLVPWGGGGSKSSSCSLSGLVRRKE